MNQTKKRLAIIKLAISMTDTETIQLQVLKLGLLKTDTKMRDILSMLNEHNYAQAQRLISSYIETPNETTIIQRTTQAEPLVPESKPMPTAEESMIEKKEVPEEQEKPLTLKEKIQQAKDQAIIEQFQLFTKDSEEKIDELQEEVTYDALLDIAPKPKKMSTENVNYDALLNVEAEDVLPNNISLNIQEDPKDTFFQEELTIKVDETRTDNFFNTETEVETTVEKEQETKANASDIILEESIVQEHVDENIINTADISTEKINNGSYNPITYIDQKFKNMTNQYPPVHNENKNFDSIDTLLVKISNDGYTEEEVEKIIKETEILSQTNKTEAALLLLVAAATESKYAKFRLARALYKGELLEKNISESFTLIHGLALNDNYPEAICDLAQFYESGIGIAKDKKRAEELYKQAMDLGIHRAIGHYKRIRKENKGFFSSLRK